MEAKVYLNIYEPDFLKEKAGARKRAINALAESGKTDFLWDDIELKFDPTESPSFKDGKMRIAGELPFGYISLDFDIDIETVVEVIEFYQKRLNKMKAVLEGLK